MRKNTIATTAKKPQTVKAFRLIRFFDNSLNFHEESYCSSAHIFFLSNYEDELQSCFCLFGHFLSFWTGQVIRKRKSFVILSFISEHYALLLLTNYKHRLPYAFHTALFQSKGITKNRFIYVLKRRYILRFLHFPWKRHSGDFDPQCSPVHR